ncbi:MAG: hypothetical protein ACREL3_07545 [Gemmatimonadales bacterium]
MPTQKVHLRGSQYVNAVSGLRQAGRLWHRLDAALVATRNREAPLADEVREVLRLLDLALYRAHTALIGTLPKSE